MRGNPAGMIWFKRGLGYIISKHGFLGQAIPPAKLIAGGARWTDLDQGFVDHDQEYAPMLSSLLT